jgi:predicted nicotinamide N-methyase
VPEIALHLATEITPIWQATEDFLARHGIEPPFWAFAWPGSQALARALLDGPPLEGRRVLDFAAGCGLAGIAAALRGAVVECAELDPLALAACRLNAALNGVSLATPAGDIVGSANRWDIILAGDVCYEAPMVAHILPWLRRMAGAGAEVRLADPAAPTCRATASNRSPRTGCRPRWSWRTGASGMSSSPGCCHDAATGRGPGSAHVARLSRSPAAHHSPRRGPGREPDASRW